MTTVERALASIGKKCFIDYYNEFKNCTNPKELAQRLLTDNDKANSYTAQITRINYAIWIFDNNQEKNALNIIINSNRLDNVTKAKAREYYSKL